MQLYPQLERLIHQLETEAAQLPDERRSILHRLRTYVDAASPARLNFICTHNSRRSHLGMIWAAVAAYRNPLIHVQTYSGGTEATALNPRMVAALRRAGFRVEDPEGDNPRYLVYYADDAPPLVCFSKTFDHPNNPRADFAAVMTCDDADQNCPFIPGAAVRIPLTYEDPKVADGTPVEAERYDERLRQIGRELLYAFRSE